MLQIVGKQKLISKSITEKYKIFKEVDKGNSCASVAKKHNILKQTLLACSHWYIDELFDDNWYCRAARADGESFQISGTWNNKLCKTKENMTSFLVNYRLFRFYLLFSFIENIVKNVIENLCIFVYY